MSILTRPKRAPESNVVAINDPSGQPASVSADNPMPNALRNFQGQRFEVNLVIDTNAYASGDVLSDRVAVALAAAIPDGETVIRGEIIGITLLDKDDVGGLLDLVFIDADVALGTINSAPSISDTDAERILAVIPVNTYTDVGGSRVARPLFDPIPFQVSTVNLYVAAISRDSKTYASASSLRVKLLIRLDNVTP